LHSHDGILEEMNSYKTRLEELERNIEQSELSRKALQRERDQLLEQVERGEANLGLPQLRTTLANVLMRWKLRMRRGVEWCVVHCCGKRRRDVK